jgi:hypothetical protein
MVVMLAVLGVSLLPVDHAFAQVVCEIRVSGDAFDALDNNVWNDNESPIDLGWSPDSSACLSKADANIDIYTSALCEARSSVVTFDYSGDAYFYGSPIGTVYPTESDCPSLGYNSYSVVGPDGSLYADEPVYSPDGHTRLIYQSDGNLVLYFWDFAIWASGTQGETEGITRVQSDGNLVVYDGSNDPVWASNTSDNNDVFLAVRDGGIIVLYNKFGDVVWVEGNV